MKRPSNKTFRNFKSLFIAQVSKFSSNYSSPKLPEVSNPLLLLANSVVDNGQRISTLAAASSETPLYGSVTTDQYQRMLSSDDFASVLRKGDQDRLDMSPF